MKAVGKLKEEMLRPNLRAQLEPLMRFRGNKDIGRMASLWNFAQAMRIEECSTLSEGGFLFRENKDLAHLCGLHSKYLTSLSLRSFFNRLALSPHVTNISKGFTEYVRELVPDPWEYKETGVFGLNAPLKAHNKRVIRELNKHGKSTDISLVFGPLGSERDLLMAIHQAVPRGISHMIRNDLCQDMLCAVLSGDIKIENVADAIEIYLRAARRFTPHSITEFVKYGDEYAGLSADGWEKQIVSEYQPTLEEAIGDLREKWGCGDWGHEAPKPRPPGYIVSPTALEKPKPENREQLETRLRRKRERELGLIVSAPEEQ